MDYSTLKGLLAEVFDLFPDEIRALTLYPNYYQYLLILRTVLPYLQEDRKVLDVGAGAGVIPLVLRKAGYECSAIDTWIEYSKEYSNRMGIKKDIIERLERNGVQVHYCDIEKEVLPFKDCSFNIVLLLDVIEHLHNSPKKVLKEIKRVLVPNDVLIITTPHLATLKNRVYLPFGRSNYVEFKEWYDNEPFFGHIREFTLHEVKNMLRREGFRVKRASLSNCLQFPAIKNFRFKPYQLLMSLYLLVTTIIPKLRYLMIVVAQKIESKEVLDYEAKMPIKDGAKP